MSEQEVPSADQAGTTSGEGEPTEGATDVAEDQESVAEAQATTAEAETEAKDKDLPPFGVDLEDTGVLRKRLTITIPRARIDGKFEENYGELSRKAQVPGFRIGRAPRRLIEKRFGSEVSQDVRNALVGEACRFALEEHPLKVLGEPELDLEKIELPDEGDLQFKVEVEIEPEFELPELSGIPVRRPKAEVSEADVDRRVDWLRSDRGTFEPLEGGPAQADDRIVADVKVEVEGQVLAEHQGVGLSVRGQVIDGIPVANLGEVLSGRAPDETAEVEADVPEDHEKEELRGKRARISIAVREIKRLRLPELNEEFLKSVGFEDEGSLRESIRMRLESELSGVIQRAMRNQISDYLLKNCTLDLPERVTLRQSERALGRRLVDLRLEGVPDEEIEKRLDQLRTSTRQQAVSDLKMFFIITRIAEKFEIQASGDEVRGRVAQIAARYGRRPERVFDQMRRENQLIHVAFQICEDKVMEKLLMDAKIEELDPPSRIAEQGDPSAEADEETDIEAT